MELKLILKLRFFQQISCDSVECGRLRDVKFDDLQLIFEYLDLPGLLAAIVSDEVVLEPAIYAFKHTFAQKMFVIDGSSFQNHTEIVAMDADRVLIKDYITTLYTLKYFGTSISRLAINYKKMNPDQIIEISKLIGEYCAEKLNEIEISCENDELDALTATFPNVMKVLFIDSRISIENLRLDKLFPKMRSFELQKVSSSNTKYLYYYFQNLESFTVKYSVLSGWFKESRLEETLKVNPQIKHIDILPATHELVTKMSQYLPDLESLILTGLSEDFFRVHSMIRFKSVKKFKLSIYRLVHLTPRFIPFEFNDQLEEFELNWGQPEITDEWRKFIGNLMSLKKLKIKWQLKKCTTIAYITELKLINLESFTMENVNVDFVELNRFLLTLTKSWNKLHEIHLLNIDKSFLDDIQQSVTEWMVSEVSEVSDNLVFNVKLHRSK